MIFNFRKSKSESNHINENQQHWYNTPEFRWHAPFVLVTIIIFTHGALTRNIGTIGFGVFLLACTMFSLALMRYARRSAKAINKKLYELRPDTIFYQHMFLHKDSINVLLPNSSNKCLGGVLVALDWGLEFWSYKMDTILTSLKWQEILGAEAIPSNIGSSAIDVLVLHLTGDRVVEFYTYTFAQIPEAFIFSRPKSNPWIAPEGEAPIR